jgi:4-amino-4-deoxy-L-arabinose transferase-like glycosyltransferase
MKELLELLRRNKWFFIFATLAALALRLFFVFVFPEVNGDTFVYGDIAKHWMGQGIYGMTVDQGVQPTLIRLPGYPGFLVVIFSLFGREHYTAVMVVQALIDTNTCLVIAALALRLMNARAAKAAYLLSALCPFTASYAAAPLTETLAICCTAHALYYGVRGIQDMEAGTPGLAPWILAGIWTALGILTRPDGGIVLAALGLGLVILLFRVNERRQVIPAGALLLAISLGPLVPWTIRNWRTFHVFQPLAPRYANDPGEFSPHGFIHWTKSWIVDYVSVYEIYWHSGEEPIDTSLLPERAFDSSQEYDKTQALIGAYNQQLSVDPELDTQFEQLARERVNHNPFRYYIWLPFLRIADMWLRPRTEMMPIESRWWEFSEHESESGFALLWAGINLLYVLAALRGWWKWRKTAASWGARRLGLGGAVLISFVLLRSAFLGSLEGPEPRYVLECFPVVLALAGGAFVRKPSIEPAHSIPS